jgi:4-hydroxy-3-polyprenylbenzoate decarboxylase
MTITTTPDLLGTELRELLTVLERQGELRHVDEANPHLELGAITELMALRDGPALLFDHLPGYAPGHRVLTNLTNSPRRVGLLFGLPADAGGIALVRTIRERFSNLKLIDPVPTTRADFAEETERGADVNLLDLPAPFWHERDGGRYLGTACSIVMRDPDENWVNLGTYRVQVHDERTLGLMVEPMHQGSHIMQRYWDAGRDCPVAVCIGTMPAVLMGSFLAMPWGTSEYGWAGALIGRPIEVVESEITGLPLPASAEIVIEGFVPPPSVETRLEGPFGETMGYYGSGASQQAVIRVEQVQHRKDPIIVGAPPMRPPGSSSASYLFRAANLWSEIERAGVPDVRGVWMHPAGSSSFLAIISIHQRYSGHVKQVAQAAMGGRAGGGQIGRFVIVVDDDIDPADIDQVLWAVATRCDPEVSIDVIRNCTSTPLDPRLTPEKRAVGDYSASRAVIDACRPFHWRDRFPQTVGTSTEYQAQILKAWPDLFGESLR